MNFGANRARAIAVALCGLAAAACGSGDGTSGSGGAGAQGGQGGGSPNGGAGGMATSTGGANVGGGGNGGANVDPNALPYMIGIKTNTAPMGPTTVEGWLGRRLDVAGTTITTTSYIGVAQPYVNADGSHPLLEVSFPLLSIFNEPNALDDLAKAANGDYDATYEAMSMKLASFANPLLSARIGWELNGSWYKWSNGVGTNATYANYIKAFQHAAIQIKKHNPHALIQWCIAWGQPDPTPYWPGAFDAANNPGGVDVISIDFYQANISHYNDHDLQSTWEMAQKGDAPASTAIDVDWMTTFAMQKGVKVALSEYGAGGPSSNGLGTGAGLDDGAWTAASIAWMNGLPAGTFLWTLWSDDAPADDIVSAGANPNEQGAWKSAWQGTHFGGTWWKGQAPP